ncbi:MAG: hypothetical protein EZS28_004738 [Streblomastix strix]|uniref:Uncharacterized protein n=1 Tax=Streblomastix strix TaxID=222440 RepID=A0A5J4WYZ3_9EUKA|nr:MAG: hypothetical protein EZS28_004738 [Streblomastix strix]
MNSATGAIFIADHRNDKVNLSEFIVEGVGKDVFLRISNKTDDCSQVIISTFLSAMFNGSQSDAGNGSIHYQYYGPDDDDELLFIGDITIHEIQDKWWQNTNIIIGIVVGLVILIAAILNTIFIKDFAPRKKKSKYGSNGQEGQYLIYHGQQEYK